MFPANQHISANHSQTCFSLPAQTKQYPSVYLDLPQCTVCVRIQWPNDRHACSTNTQTEKEKKNSSTGHRQHHMLTLHAMPLCHLRMKHSRLLQSSYIGLASSRNETMQHISFSVAPRRSRFFGCRLRSSVIIIRFSYRLVALRDWRFNRNRGPLAEKNPYGIVIFSHRVTKIYRGVCIFENFSQRTHIRYYIFIYK